MGIKSTVYWVRSDAISRIQEIYNLISTKNFRELEKRTSEPEYNMLEYVKDYHKNEIANGEVDIDNIENYTNKMLGDIMDEPYYRMNIFENYLISDDEEYECPRCGTIHFDAYDADTCC